MKSGGFGLFEIWNAIPVTKIKEKPLTTVSKVKYKNMTIERQRGFTLISDDNKTIAEVNYLYTISDSSNKKVIKDKHIMRAFYKEEIENIFNNNGFSIKNIFANSKKETFNTLSNKILIHFMKE